MSEKLTENKELLDIMESAGKEDYAEAVEKISKMEQNNKSIDEQEEVDDYKNATERLFEKYKQEKDGVELEYDLKGNEVGEAIKIFQKKTIFKRNILYTVLLGLIFVIYLSIIFNDSTNALGYIVAFGSIVVMYFVWALPKRHIKSVVAATEAVNDIFTAAVYSDCLFAGGGENITKVDFTEKSFVVENKDGIIIGADKQRLFLFPFRCMTEENKDKLKKILKESFGDRYENKNEVIANG